MDLLVIILIISLLTFKELLRAANSVQYRSRRGLINLAMVPLLILFMMVIVGRLISSFL